MNIQPQKQNLRKAQAEERRLQILEVALKVFASNGFKGTSIKDIAEAADISMGLMYYYFASKEELLEATVEHHSFLPQMKQILTDTQGRPMTEVFNDLAIGFLDLLNTKSGLVKIFLQEVESNSLIKKAWSNLVHEGVSLLKQYIDSQVSDGKLKPHRTEATARSLLGIIFMFHYTQDIFRSSQIKREEYIQDVLTTILEGIKVK
jgi:TetR/AcrR family transcriptional regulator, cholesterol catabolism regulator